MNEIGVHGYRFGGYLLEAGERRLLRLGVVIPLKPRAFDALLYLVERAGHLVTKEELMERLWPDVVVEESNLAKNIWLIRRALGESEGEARFIETVPRSGYRFIAPVERWTAPPAEAPAVASLPAAAESSRPVATLAGPAPPRRPGQAWKWGLGIGAVIIGSLGAWALLARSGGRPAFVPPAAASATTPSGARRAAVAVLGFANLGRQPDASWLSVALAEMLTADLAAGERLRLVSGSDAARLGQSLPSAPGPLSREALNAARDQVDADYVVKGSYLALSSPDGEILRVDVTLQNTASGDTVLTVSRTGATHRLFAVVDEAAAQLRTRLGIDAPAAPAAAAAQASVPTRPEATRLYAEGLARLRSYDALGARPLFEQAVAAEPQFPLAHLFLSQALAALGYDQRAIAEAQAAAKLSGQLPREEQLHITAGLAEAQKDWTTAESGYRALFEFFPDNIEYGLDLLRVEIAAGKAREGLVLVGVLRRVVPPSDPDARIDLAEATAHGALAEYPQQLAAAEKAMALARRHGLRLLLGEALGEEAAAFSSLGRVQEEVAARREGAGIFHELGNVNAEASTLLALANLRMGAADYGGAAAGYQEALATFERIGNRKGASHALEDLANMSWLQGDVDGAERSARRALALSRETNDRPSIVWGLGAIGNMLADRGDIDQALAMQTEALTISREIGHRAYAAFCLGAVGDTYFAAGRLSEALSQYRQAESLCHEVHDGRCAAAQEAALGNVAQLQDRLGDAEHLYASALAALQQADEKDTALEVRLNLAQLRHEQGRDAESLALARELAHGFAELHQVGNGVMALATTALAEMRLRQLPAAMADSAAARALLQGNRQNQPRYYLLLAESRVRAASGAFAPARSLLAAARSTAEKMHALATVFEARLVEGEIGLHDRPPAARQELVSLAADARASGFLLIAKKATALAAGGSTADAYP